MGPSDRFRALCIRATKALAAFGDNGTNGGGTGGGTGVGTSGGTSGP